jgi:hypothetical protein
MTSTKTPTVLISVNHIVDTANKNSVERWGIGTLARDRGSVVVERDPVSGSHTIASRDGGWFATVAPTLSWADATSEVRNLGGGFGNCRYFVAWLPEGVMGYHGACYLKDIYEIDRGDIRVAVARHTHPDGGPRFEAVYNGAFMGTTRRVFVCIGAASGKAEDAFDLTDDTSYATFTWHPGFPLAPGEEITELHEKVPMNAVVKLSEAGLAAALARHDSFGHEVDRIMEEISDTLWDMTPSRRGLAANHLIGVMQLAGEKIAHPPHPDGATRAIREYVAGIAVEDAMPLAHHLRSTLDFIQRGE